MDISISLHFAAFARFVLHTDIECSHASVLACSVFATSFDGLLGRIVPYYFFYAAYACSRYGRVYSWVHLCCALAGPLPSKCKRWNITVGTTEASRNLVLWFVQALANKMDFPILSPSTLSTTHSMWPRNAIGEPSLVNRKILSTVLWGNATNLEATDIPSIWHLRTPTDAKNYSVTLMKVTL